MALVEALVAGEANMSRALVDSSRYSPGNVRAEVLEQLFVGRDREKIVRDILDRITESATSGNKHSFLLIGPRGIGKTHLLNLLHHRLMQQPKLAKVRKKLLVAFLNEEEWGVASYLDLLMVVLRAVGAEAVALDEIRARFKKDEVAAIALAEGTLKEIAGDRTLLLLCENLVDLFVGLDEEGQKRWRSFIQESAMWSIVATTPAIFDGVKLRSDPFFGFFTTRQLDPIDLETAIELVRAKLRVEKRDALADMLSTPIGRARMRAIHHLAGGNHRVYVAMCDFLDRQSLEDLKDPFMKMVDDFTPYYQERMRMLASPQQRKIIEHLCRARRALPVKAIAEECLMSQQTAAKQLGLLAQSSIVRKEEHGRESYYELAEPLMRICVEVKDNQSQHLSLFVDFLREWFTKRELEAKLALVDARGDREIDRLHLHEALKGEASGVFLDALHEEVVRTPAVKGDRSAIEALHLLARDRRRPEDQVRYVRALRESGDTKKALSVVREVAARHPSDSDLRFEHARSLEAEDPEGALREVDASIALGTDDGRRRCLRGRLLGRLERFDELIANEARALELEPKHIHSFMYLARAYEVRGEWPECARWAAQWIDAAPNDSAAWALRAHAAFEQLDIEHALEFIDRSVALGPKDVPNRCARGSTLMALGRYEEVLDNEDELLAIEPDHAHSYMTKASALLALGRIGDAKRVLLDRLEKTEPPEELRWMLAEIYLKEGSTREAIHVAENIVPSSVEERVQLARIFLDAQVPARVFQVLEGDETSADAFDLRCAATLQTEGLEALGALLKKAMKSPALRAHSILWGALISKQEPRSAIKVLGTLDDGDLSVPSVAWRAASLWLDLDQPDRALVIAEHISATKPTKTSLELQARALLELGRYDEALVIAERIGPRAVELWTMALAATRGVARALDRSGEHLRALAEPALTSALTAAMLMDLRAHGMATLAKSLKATRAHLRLLNKEPLLGAILVQLFAPLVKKNLLAASGTLEAIEEAETLVRDVASCMLPMQSLRVGAQYLTNRDARVLLELPLELRALLKEELNVGSRS